MLRRAPSWEFMVVCRDTGANEDEDDVEVVEGACSVATDMSARAPATRGSPAADVLCWSGRSVLERAWERRAVAGSGGGGGGGGGGHGRRGAGGGGVRVGGGG